MSQQVRQAVSNFTSLGIDTSNYTSSAAVFFDGQIEQSKKLLPVKDGQVGLRQSDAVFHHTKQLSEVLSPLLTKYQDIKVIGVSDKPRNVAGSYMPCFLVGMSTAKVLSDAKNIPLYSFSHQEGHVAAALFSCDKTKLLEKEFIALHLSGGTSEILHVKNTGDVRAKIEIIGKTLDLNAGQLLDRIALMLGFSFPGGKELDRLAMQYDKKIKTKTSVKGFDFSLSGVENIAKGMIEASIDKEEISATCLSYVLNNIEKSLENAVKEYENLPIIFSGGVSCSEYIRKHINKNFDSYFASASFSADNAAGTAYLAERMMHI